MSGFYLTNADANYSVDKIFEEMLSVFNRYGRLLVLLDKTIDNDSFDDLLKHFKDENIIYLPLALGNKPKDTNLFFVEINKKEILEKVGKDISEKVSMNFEIENSTYLVHGFGASLLENKLINERFKKSLVLKDTSSKFLFRWYDPRVLTYLDQIFTEHELNGLLGIFETWNFIHPMGYFSWSKKNNEKFISRNINKISNDQSIALDLIEVSNLVFIEAHKLEQINSNYLMPQNILNNLLIAHELYKIKKYTDLVSYGLYAEVLGEKFMQHDYTQQVLKKYWNVEPENYSFTEAMNFISEDSWDIIKNSKITKENIE